MGSFAYTQGTCFGEAMKSTINELAIHETAESISRFVDNMVLGVANGEKVWIGSDSTGSLLETVRLHDNDFYVMYTSLADKKQSPLQRAVLYSLEQLLSLVKDDYNIEGVIVYAGESFSILPGEAAGMILGAGQDKRNEVA